MYILYYSREPAAGSGKAKHVLICAADDNLADVRLTQDLLYHSSVFTEYASVGLRFMTAALGEMHVPVITVSRIGQLTAQLINCTQIYAIVSRTMDMHDDKNLSRDEISAIQSKLVPMYNGNASLSATVIASCVQQHLWELTETLDETLKIDLSFYDPDFINQTKLLIDSANAGLTSAFSPDEMMNNATCHQNLCTDKFYISIPSREALLETKIVRSKADDEQVEDREVETDPHSFIPPRDSVCIPYENAVFDTPMFKDGLGGEGLAMSQPVKFRAVVGNTDNNGLPVQDNEIEYYEALVKWIKFNIKAFYMQDIDTIDPLSLSYMEALVSELYMWHWQHNINVPYCYRRSNDMSDGISSDYEFRQYPGFSDSRQNAVPALLGFLKVAASELGYTVYPQAVIQLGRWGSRKGTQIQFREYGYVFDLGTNTVSSKVSSKAEYSLKLQNGKMAVLTGLVWDRSQIADKSVGFRVWPMPVGAALEMVYESSDDAVGVTMYYSMIDLVRELVLGRLTVDGITFKGKFSVDDGRRLKNVDLDTVFQEAASERETFKYPIFRSQGLIDLYMNLNTNYSSGQETQFSLMNLKLANSEILNMIDKNSFSTYSELTEMIGNAGNRKQVIDYMIVRDLVKVYHAVASVYRQGSGIESVINQWHQAILDTGYVNESYFYADRTNREEPLPGTKLGNASVYFWHSDPESRPSESGRVSKLASFGTTAKPEERGSAASSGRESEESSTGLAAFALSRISSFLIREAPPNSVYYRAVYRGKTLAVAAYTSFEFNGRKFRQFTILDNDTAEKVKSEQQINQEISIFELIPYTIHALALIVNGGPFSEKQAAPSQIYFNKREAVITMRSVCQKILAIEREAGTD